MSGRGHHSGIGFGGAVGLGIAASTLITIIAIGHALGRQLTAAMSVVIVFAEVALCTLLGAVVLGALGLLAHRGQLARYDLAERRLTLEQHAREVYAVRAEVLEADTDTPPISQAARPSILGKRASNLPGSNVTRLPVGRPGGDGA